MFNIRAFCVGIIHCLYVKTRILEITLGVVALSCLRLHVKAECECGGIPTVNCKRPVR